MMIVSICVLLGVLVTLVLLQDHPVDAPVEAAVSLENFGVVLVEDLGQRRCDTRGPAEARIAVDDDPIDVGVRCDEGEDRLCVPRFEQLLLHLVGDARCLANLIDEVRVDGDEPVEVPERQLQDAQRVLVGAQVRGAVGIAWQADRDVDVGFFNVEALRLSAAMDGDALHVHLILRPITQPCTNHS